MGVREKAAHFAARLKGIFGSTYKPLRALLGGGKRVVKGAASTGWKIIKLLPGLNGDQEEDTGEQEEAAP